MTPEQLEELKSKYPLAFDTIKLPVRYLPEYNLIVDSSEQTIVRIDPHYLNNESPEPRQYEVGELIAHLLNQLK